MSFEEKSAATATERRGSENYPEHHKGRVEQVHADGQFPIEALLFISL